MDAASTDHEDRVGWAFEKLQALNWDSARQYPRRSLIINIGMEMAVKVNCEYEMKLR